MAKKATTKPNAEKPAKPVKAAKPKTVKMTSDALDKLQEAEELLERIEAKEVECGEKAREMYEQETEVDSAKEILKGKKAAYEISTNELRELIRARSEKHPLFDAAAQPGDEPKKEAEGWPSLPLAEAMIPESEVLFLKSVGIITIGDLQAFSEKHGENWAKEIGMNEQSAATVAGKLDQYFEKIGSEVTATDAKAWRTWKTSLLVEHGLPKGKLKLLESNGFGTLGRLMDAISGKENQESFHRDIKGFGESGYEALTDSIMALRKANPEFQADAV